MLRAPPIRSFSSLPTLRVVVICFLVMPRPVTASDPPGRPLRQPYHMVTIEIYKAPTDCFRDNVTLEPTLTILRGFRDAYITSSYQATVDRRGKTLGMTKITAKAKRRYDDGEAKEILDRFVDVITTFLVRRVRYDVFRYRYIEMPDGQRNIYQTIYTQRGLCAGYEHLAVDSPNWTS